MSSAAISSIPIATSTPVSLPAGPVSPPPLTNNAESNAVKPSSQYPAVLKGSNIRTTAASPPNPNLVPSGKVPPPVPPRGSISARGKPDSSSARGDNHQQAQLRQTSPARLHGLDQSSLIMHENFLSPRQSTPAIRQLNPRLVFSKRDTVPIQLIREHIYLPQNAGQTRAVAAIPEEMRSHRRNTEFIQYGQMKAKLPNRDDDEDEFVSVEKVDDFYVIKTSPYPFRPERARRRKRKTNVQTNDSFSHFSNNTDLPQIQRLPASSQHLESDYHTSTGYTPTIDMPKFTYFINPKGNTELMNWKMSRKDKKHSETYSERMRRIQEEHRETNKIDESTVPNVVIDKSNVKDSKSLSQSNDNSKSALKMIRVKYSERKQYVHFSGLKTQLGKRTSWVKSFNRPKNDEATDESSTFLSISRTSKSKNKCNPMDQDYYDWKKKQKLLLRNEFGLNPNVKKTLENEPDGLMKTLCLSDEQYKEHLDKQLENRKVNETKRNSSFLHGYVNDKEYHF